MKTKTAQTVLDKEEYDKLEAKAKRKGHTVSSILRYLVKRYLTQK